MKHLAGLLLLLACCAAWTQTADDVEKRIANLPPAQQSYERFRYWITMLPPDQQRAGDPMPRYREYLQSRGFTGPQIDEQVKLVESEGRRAEIERWNRALTAEKPAFNTNPNEFLMAMAKGRKPGTALDVGMGQGRNAIWLAQQGWDVTGFDPAERAVALARANAARLGVQLHTEIKGSEDFDFGERRWDLILLSWVGGRDIAATVQRALKPGGIVIVEAAHRDATRGRSIGGGVVFDTGELPRLFPELRSVRYEEPMAVSDFGRERVRLVRYCGERPE